MLCINRIGSSRSAALILFPIAALMLGAPPTAFAQWLVAECGQDSYTGLVPCGFQPGPPHWPKRTIQAAVNVAADGHTIHVFPGSYAGNINTLGKQITIVALGGPDVTFIDCGGIQRAFAITNGEGPGTIIEGFTIRNCVALGGVGGGMLILNSSPTIENCVFDNNRAEFHGGAVECSNGSPSFIECTFKNNRAGVGPANFGDGGAVRNTNNSEPTFVDCIFEDNESGWQSDGGGAMYNLNSSPTLFDCTLENNGGLGVNRGGAMYNHNSDPTIWGCWFIDNLALVQGGAIFNTGSAPDIRNCNFVENEAFFEDGGAIANVAASSLYVQNCAFLDNVASSGRGGGIFSTGSAPSVINSYFKGNIASTDGPAGGGVYSAGGPTVVSATVFEDNVAEGMGGGLYVSGPGQITGGRFENNFASYGGGVAAEFAKGMSIQGPTWFLHNTAIFDGGGLWSQHPVFFVGGMAGVSRCEFGSNTALLGSGGGMWGFAKSISNCLFENNSAAVTAGGLMFQGGLNATVDRSTFRGNQAFEAAAIFAGMAEGGLLTVVNTLVHDNESELVPKGGGVIGAGPFAGPPCDIALINSTVVHNPGGGLMVVNTQNSTVINSILRDNAGFSINHYPGFPLPAVSYSNVETAAPVWAGAGNINSDPLFVDGANRDFRLSASSPAIDAGDNTAVPAGITVDLAGDPRFVDDPGTPDSGVGPPPVVDMGSYEFQGVSSLPCPADINGDGAVGVPDLLELLACWGPVVPSCLGADLTGDNIVGVPDLLQLLAQWGPCMP